MQFDIATFTPRQSDDVHKHRKETSFRRQLSLIDLDAGHELVTVRFYGNGSRHYCCVWTSSRNGKLDYARGSAWAGGYGYHKDSDAMEQALKVAGFNFAEHFGGTGETGEEAALEAIARFVGAERFLIVRAHP